jgi:hypothetical protein
MVTYMDVEHVDALPIIRPQQVLPLLVLSPIFGIAQLPNTITQVWISKAASRD